MHKEVNYFENFYQHVSSDTDLLERNANDFPYSSLAGFLLLCHYKKIKHPDFEKLSKKTALHFQNSNWLQFLLDQAPDEEMMPATSSTAFIEEPKEVNEMNRGEEGQTSYPGDRETNTEDLRENQPFVVKKSEVPEQEELLIAPENSARENFQLKSEETFINSASPGEISFEPLHTVDYFASQGIKITEEPVANDKLGKQVKSFTAWLKSMKKVHPSEPVEQDAALEKLVQNAAEQSNINTEVYTEAMAEVLVKQDKKEKAIEMYQQLSLTNPSKSAYFAAKIDNIKSS